MNKKIFGIAAVLSIFFLALMIFKKPNAEKVLDSPIDSKVLSETAQSAAEKESEGQAAHQEASDKALGNTSSADASSADAKLEGEPNLKKSVAFELRLADAQQEFRDHFKKITERYPDMDFESHISCSKDACEINAPFSKDEPQVKQAILIEAQDILKRLSQKPDSVVKSSSYQSRLNDKLEAQVTFFGSEEEKQQASASLAKSVENFASVMSKESYQDFIAGQGTMPRQESLVRYIVKQYQDRSALPSIDDIRSECKGSKCDVFLKHKTYATNQEAEEDIFELGDIIKKSAKLLSHGVSNAAIQNVIKNGETRLTMDCVDCR